MTLYFRPNSARIQAECHDSIFGVSIRNVGCLEDIAGFGLAVTSEGSFFRETRIIEVDYSFRGKIMTVAWGEDDPGFVGMADFGSCFEEGKQFLCEDKVSDDIGSL